MFNIIVIFYTAPLELPIKVEASINTISLPEQVLLNYDFNISIAITLCEENVMAVEMFKNYH